MKRIAIFPGSFDPFTIGHKAVVEDGLMLFDHIIVAIGMNREKKGFLTPENRVKLIEDIFRNEQRVSVEIYENLTGDFCREKGAKFMLRGMRNTVDFEYERNMMIVNQAMFPELETVLLFTPPKYVAVSSSIIRDIESHGGDSSQFMPEGIDLKNYL